MTFFVTRSTTEVFVVLLYWFEMFCTLGCASDTKSKQSAILHDLFMGYDSDEHPLPHGSGPVIVTFGAKLVRLIELREKANTIQTQWWIQQRWQNSRLSWNETKYHETSVNVVPTRVWTPDVLLYNRIPLASSGETNDRLPGGVEKFKTKVIIKSSGYNKWYAPAMFKSTCDIDPQYFPFDDQHCRLQFGSWSFDQSKLDINVDLNETGIKEDIYQKNSEWQVVEVKAEKFVKKYPCCPHAYSSIILHIHFRRHYKYYIVNLVIPCSLIAAMILLSFILPPESGERIGLGITVLMAMAIFQELTSEKLPVDSKNIPLLARYYATGITEIGLALVFTAFIINFHHRKTKMPAWFRKITFGCLGKLVNIKLVRFSEYKPLPIEMKPVPKRKSLYNNCSCGQLPESRSLSIINNEDTAGGELNNINADVKNRAKDQETSISESQEDIQMVHCKVAEETARNIKEWQTAAQILDRVLLVVGVIVSLISFMAIFLQAPRVYEMLQIN